ncbi:MAG: HepT-like ribonuclease domain-containing protein, partial [Cyanobacteria bacterium J06598_3]
MYRDKASLQDILDAGQSIMDDAKELTRAELEKDGRRLRSIAYSVLVIGEATTRLSSNLREDYPDVPWKRMVGMRNIMAHQYDKIDLDILWNAVHKS